MLEDVKKSYLRCASIIPNWTRLTVTQLADGYIDTPNPSMKSAYFAALMCQYWYQIRVLDKKNKGSDIPIEECYGWVIEGIQRALGARWGQRWRRPGNKLYGDPNAVDKAIKRCILSVRAGYYQDANRLKRKANYATESLEQKCDEYGDYYLNEEETTPAYSSSLDSCYNLIQEKFQEGALLEALILDEICYQDCFKEGRLNRRKVVADLRNLNDNYIKYLIQRYGVSQRQIQKAQIQLAEMSNPSIYRRFDRLIKHLQSSGGLR